MPDAVAGVVLEIEDCEAQLRTAMLGGDAEALDALLDDALIFTNQDGARLDKAQDLAAHRSGLLRIDRIDATNRAIRVLDDSALVAVLVNLAGSYADRPFAGAFAYTRIWHRAAGRWRVVAAHCSAAAPHDR